MRDDGLRGGSAGASGVPVPFSPTRTAFRTAPASLSGIAHPKSTIHFPAGRRVQVHAVHPRLSGRRCSAGRLGSTALRQTPRDGEVDAGAAGPRRQVREDLVDGPARRAERPLRARRRLSRSRPVTPAAPRRSITHGSSLHASKIRRSLRVGNPWRTPIRRRTRVLLRRRPRAAGGPASRPGQVPARTRLPARGVCSRVGQHPGRRTRRTAGAASTRTAPVVRVRIPHRDGPPGPVSSTAGPPADLRPTVATDRPAVAGCRGKGAPRAP